MSASAEMLANLALTAVRRQAAALTKREPAAQARLQAAAVDRVNVGQNVTLAQNAVKPTSAAFPRHPAAATPASAQPAASQGPTAAVRVAVRAAQTKPAAQKPDKKVTATTSIKTLY